VNETEISKPKTTESRTRPRRARYQVQLLALSSKNI